MPSCACLLVSISGRPDTPLLPEPCLDRYKSMSQCYGLFRYAAGLASALRSMDPRIVAAPWSIEEIRMAGL
nr:hypothetical protein CFP56_78398 [Quercus suber]